MKAVHKLACEQRDKHRQQYDQLKKELAALEEKKKAHNLSKPSLPNKSVQFDESIGESAAVTLKNPKETTGKSDNSNDCKTDLGTDVNPLFGQSNANKMALAIIKKTSKLKAKGVAAKPSSTKQNNKANSNTTKPNSHDSEVKDSPDPKKTTQKPSSKKNEKSNSNPTNSSSKESKVANNRKPTTTNSTSNKNDNAKSNTNRNLSDKLYDNVEVAKPMAQSGAFNFTEYLEGLELISRDPESLTTEESRKLAACKTFLEHTQKLKSNSSLRPNISEHSPFNVLAPNTKRSRSSPQAFKPDEPNGKVFIHFCNFI